MQRTTGLSLALAIALLCGCGGTSGGTNGAAGQLAQPAPNQQATVEVENGSANLPLQLSNLAKPANVDPALWNEIKVTFAKALGEFQADKQLAQAPSGMANEITDLVVVVEADGSATFTWSYLNIGDYNQDKEVGVPDLSEIAVNWYANANDGENDASEQVIDGDANGEVSGSDISQIAIHFASTVEGYTLQVQYLGTDEWLDAAVIPFENGSLPPGGGWLSFAYNLQSPTDGASYRVVPHFGDSGEDLGQPSAEVAFDASSLGKPQNLAASGGTIAGAIELTWSPMEGAANFRIFTSETEPGSFSLLDSSTPLSTTYLHSGLAEGEQVWYKLQGVLAGGITPFSEAVQGSTMARPLQAENLSVSEGQFYDHIHLEWDAVAGATSYKVMRSETAGGPFQEIASVAGTAYDDYAITPGTPYFYTIIASNDAGDAQPGSEVSGRAAIPDDPPAVESVSPTVGAAGESIEFSAVISGGIVTTYAWDFGGGATPGTSATTNPTVTLAALGVYSASLTVSSEFGEDTYPFTLDVGNPPDITGVTPTVGVSGTSTVFVPTFSSSVDTWAWNYGGAGTPGSSPLETPEVVLGAGGEYQASVVATNQYGTDSFDFNITVLAPPGIPGGLAASDGLFTGRIRLGWIKPPLATGYEIYRDNQVTPVATVGDVDAWDDTSAAAQDFNLHTYWIIATNSDGSSGFSDPDTGFVSLSPPGSFSASDGTQTDRVRLAWATVSGATDYKIYRDNDTNLVHTTSSGDGSTAMWDDMSISDFETYSYWITGFNTNGDGPASQDTGFMAFGNTWDTHEIDGSGVVGNWSSLQIIAGKPAVSYFDTAGGIKYARATTANPTQASDWVYHTVDGVPLPGGENLGSLGADLAELNGKPVIVYHNALWGDLKIAKANTATPSSNTDWTIYVLDSLSDVGTYARVLVIEGYAAVCYRDHTNADIKFAMAKELDPLDGSATYWDIYTLDSTDDLGFEGIDLVPIGGKPAVAYYDLTSGNLKYATASVSRPSEAGQWSVSEAVTTGNIGKWPCLVELSGKPAVSYYDVTHTSLQYARALVANPSGTSDWVAMDVDIDGDCGNFGTSLLAVGGRPSIAYFRDGSQDLRYSSAFSGVPTAEADWYLVDIDTSPSTGYYPSQIMLGGLPALTYRGGSSLLYAVPGT